jgi:cysteine-rich repeat protein
MIRKLGWVLPFVLALTPVSVFATDITGDVDYSGTVTFAAPIAGITATDLTVTPSSETEATGNGEHCDINSVTSDSPDGLGAYPSGGQVSTNITVGHGGPQVPDGECIVTIRASGTDGVSVSARGSKTVLVDAATIGASGTVSPVDIVVRQSKAIAGADKYCLKYVKKQLKARAKCNILLLQKGPAGAAKCKDYAIEEPLTGCDPGNFVEAILALAHGSNDQQTDPMNADDIDEVDMKDEINCQKYFGKAAVNFAAKRAKLVQKKCVEAGDDDQACRNTQTNDAKPKLDLVNNCTVDQDTDGGTGRVVADVGAPCDVCIDGLGAIDKKCLRGCFQLELTEMTDGIVGDLPECGNGIVQQGEFCDDGNTTPGDCCSGTCTVEAGTTEGPNGDATCTDLLDNDCDGDVDAAEPDCL